MPYCDDKGCWQITPCVLHGKAYSVSLVSEADEPTLKGSLFQLAMADPDVRLAKQQEANVSRYYGFVRNPTGEIVGGIHCNFKPAMKHLHVDVLWCATSIERSGWARQLVLAAEDWAVSQGATTAGCATLSFQAPGFYKKMGYHELNVSAGWPDDHSNHIMHKVLSGDSTTARFTEKDGLVMSFTSTPEEADAEKVASGLNVHNAGFADLKSPSLGRAPPIVVFGPEGQLMGGSLVFLSWGYVHVIMIFVELSYRRRGIGRAQVQLLKETYGSGATDPNRRKRGILASVTHVHADPARSRNFLERVGFELQYATTDEKGNVIEWNYLLNLNA